MPPTTRLIIVASIMRIWMVIRESFKIFSPTSKWTILDQDTALNFLIEDIKRAKQRILIFDNSYWFYNSKAVLDALDEKNIPIEIVLHCDSMIDAPLREMALRKRNMYLGRTLMSNKGRYFRVIDYDYVFLTDGSPKTYYKRLSNVRFLPGTYGREFDELKIYSTGDVYPIK
jgi:hypothetical protein